MRLPLAEKPSANDFPLAQYKFVCSGQGEDTFFEFIIHAGILFPFYRLHVLCIDPDVLKKRRDKVDSDINGIIPAVTARLARISAENSQHTFNGNRGS